ncbi:MAG TPA: GNAT family N-acetyltransferase [Bacteroidia bacterium]|nr:GNAT family N-acetyltransferase [Bacteroidia bacterium]
MIIKEPQTKEEFEQYYHLRWEMLRKPWGFPKGSEKTDDEDKCIHAIILDEKTAVTAVCRLQFNSDEEAQIRFMAVKENMQGKGLGKKIISFMEDKARERKRKKIILHARENAVEFYKSCGYSGEKKSHVLWGVIHHRLMEKNL